MKILIKVLELDIGYTPFKNFESIFRIFDEDGDQLYPDKVGFFLPINDRQLQKYSQHSQQLTSLDWFNMTTFQQSLYQLKLSLKEIYMRPPTSNQTIRVEHCLIDL